MTTEYEQAMLDVTSALMTVIDKTVETGMPISCRPDGDGDIYYGNEEFGVILCRSGSILFSGSLDVEAYELDHPTGT